METVRPKLPWLSILFCALICLKIFSGLSYTIQASGFLSVALWIEIILMGWVALALVVRVFAPRNVKAIATVISLIILMDLSIIFFTFNGFGLPSNLYAQLIGAEITYLITIAYCLFSKKFRAFKSQ